MKRKPRQTPLSSQFGRIGLNVAASAVTNWTYNSASSQDIVGQFGATPSLLTISGTLDKSGAGTLTFRSNSVTTNPLNLSVGSGDPA